MADGVLVGAPVCVNDLANEDDVLIESVCEDNSNNSDSVKSGFFMLSERDQLCSKFQLNGSQTKSCPDLDCRLMSSDTEEFTEVLKSISEENYDDCRKKRCADRYDSSESSDSGVAALSCTDCSSGGSSSGTSDITDPGSPFSTSSHSESDVEISPSKMPPTQSTAWPWADRPPPQQRYFLHNKRFSKNSVRTKCCKQQGKITEYFKAQHKTQRKCDLKTQINNCDVVRANLAVHISGSVGAQLPFVFQQTDLVNEVTVPAHNRNNSPPTPFHRKTIKSSRSEYPLQVTSVFLKPNSVTTFSPCTTLDSDSSVLSKPKTLSLNNCLKPVCSTPNSSLSKVHDLPLSVSTVDQCSDKPSLPSPILRNPSTIRFPVRNGWKGHFLSDIICRWSGCEESFSTTTTLLEHLQVKHVNTQSLSETFVCLWIGCKVYDKASCSRSWLERHVLSHGGNKPFRCIVDGCGQRFSSQIILERHVNQHFNQSDNSNTSGASSKRSLESTPNKLFRRNGKKLRYRRQPFSARMYDYIDTGIMEGVQHSLLETTKLQSLGQLDCASGNTVTFHSQVIGRRTTADGSAQVLLRWFPNNIVADEWVPQSVMCCTRQVPRSQCQDWCRPPLFVSSQRCRKRSVTR